MNVNTNLPPAMNATIPKLKNKVSRVQPALAALAAPAAPVANINLLPANDDDGNVTNDDNEVPLPNPHYVPKTYDELKALEATMPPILRAKVLPEQPAQAAPVSPVPGGRRCSHRRKRSSHRKTHRKSHRKSHHKRKSHRKSHHKRKSHRR